MGLLSKGQETDPATVFKTNAVNLVKSGDNEELTLLLSDIGDLPKSVLDDAVDLAVKSGRLGATRLLLQNGATVNGGGAMTDVVGKQRYDMFKLLCEFNVDFSSKSSWYRDEPDRALYLKKIQVMRKEMENEKRRQELAELKAELTSVKSRPETTVAISPIGPKP